jgi:hypothetical protein
MRFAGFSRHARDAAAMPGGRPATTANARRPGGGIFNGVGSVTLIATTVALNDPDNCEPLHTIAGCFF